MIKQKEATEKIAQKAYNGLKITITKKDFMKIRLVLGITQATKKLNKELQVEEEPP